MTTGPVTTGPALIIPKQHTAYLADPGEKTGRHLWTITHRTAAAIQNSGIKCEGINLFLADDEAAFQEIHLLHRHIFPRYPGDTFKLDADWDVKPPRQELDEVANMIMASYDKLWTTTVVIG